MAKDSIHKQNAEHVAKDFDLSVKSYDPGNSLRVKVFEKPDQDYFDSGYICHFVGRNAWLRAADFLGGYRTGRTYQQPGRKEE
jgi:hypothetical protein